MTAEQLYDSSAPTALVNLRFSPTAIQIRDLLATDRHLTDQVLSDCEVLQVLDEGLGFDRLQLIMADEAQLAAVFELCQPRKKDRKISLRRLESLFEEHTNSKVSYK